jgi:hypothetical protein
MSTENPMSLSASSSLRARLLKMANWEATRYPHLDLDTATLIDLLREAAKALEGADELSAALDAHQAEENSVVAGGSTVPVREPEATPHDCAECGQPCTCDARQAFDCLDCVQCNERKRADVTRHGCYPHPPATPASSPPERSEGWVERIRSARQFLESNGYVVVQARTTALPPEPSNN